MKSVIEENNSKKIKLLKPMDVILILLLILVAVLVFFSLKNVNSDNLQAIVKQNGGVIKTINLTSNEEQTEEIVVDGYHLIIEFNSQGIKVKSANCADKVCVNTGKIISSGDAIVCLPARVSIELIGSSKVDMVVG